MLHHHGPLYGLFAASNVLIACGYLTISVSGARFIRLANTQRSRAAAVFAAIFFAGCAGTHLAMLDAHNAVTPFWTAWHVVQAIGTWGAIILGRTLIRDAYREWRRWRDNPADAPPAAIWAAQGDHDDP